MVSVELDVSIIPLGTTAHQTAGEFAAQQATVPKGRQVYLNTLAVYAVHYYLQWREIPTALAEGDSWHPLLRSLFDSADLVLPAIGKLECRPLLVGERSLTIPLVAHHDRVAYVGVEFGENLHQATLVGFIPAIAPLHSDTLPLERLHPLEELVDYLNQIARLRHSAHQVTHRLVDLGQWLQGLFAPDWQPTEAMAGLAFRSSPPADSPAPKSSSIRRVKRIELGDPPNQRAIAQFLELTPQPDGTIDICLKIYPLGEFLCLPPDLHLAILDAAGNVYLQTASAQADNWIQLNLSASSEEAFSIQLTLGNYSVDQPFIA